MIALTTGMVISGDNGESKEAFLEAELAAFCKALPEELTEDQVAAVRTFAEKIAERRARTAAVIK